ncbi:MAG: twitching motility protein PilT [Lachnospiraceae bacterium]|nr:twitching motility protein PilT [Lachnospiraceae bacterium]
MISIISGEKGKGKTKHLFEKVERDLKECQGSLVYVDKSQKHMYELPSKVRLINASEYPLDSTDAFVGFICGIVSQNSDIEVIYMDSFLSIAYVDTSDGLISSIEKLEKISELYKVDFVLSVSKNEADLPESLRDRIIISL